jgi:Ras GTPase-activating-like protein IQGAP2/3
VRQVHKPVFKMTRIVGLRVSLQNLNKKPSEREMSSSDSESHSEERKNEDVEASEEEEAVEYHSDSDSDSSEEEVKPKQQKDKAKEEWEQAKQNLARDAKLGEAYQAIGAKTTASKDLDIPWFEQRECLFLLLKARMMLREMVEIRYKEERIEKGNLSINEIRNLLKGQSQDTDDTDWIAEIQELRRNLIAQIRKNHELERDVQKLDKKIALLIKNRHNIKGLLGLDKKKKPKKGEANVARVQLTEQQLEGYSNLFYLLQTEPQYLARLVTLLREEDMEGFLDTMMLSLFGDGFSPREEFLILSLFKLAITQEMEGTKSVGDFLKADTIVPKMIITYNRRKQGIEYLKKVIGPVVVDVMGKADLNLEVNPKIVYQAMINEEEIQTGQKSKKPKNLSEEKIMEIEEVKTIIKGRFKALVQICDDFLTAVQSNLNKVPYGIRYICKEIQENSQRRLPSGINEIMKVIGYFVYYRFHNIAIVTPETFQLVDKELSMNARKNLVVVSKVLQNLFTLNKFSETGGEKYFTPMNEWIDHNTDSVKSYFEELIEISDPADFLRVDKYNELTLKVKPVVIMSVDEIMQTHKHLLRNEDKLLKFAGDKKAKDKKDKKAKKKPSKNAKDAKEAGPEEDPLGAILKSLPAPVDVPEQDNREIQLTLQAKFGGASINEDDVDATATIYSESKELVIGVLKALPDNVLDPADNDLEVVLKKARDWAKESKKKNILDNIARIDENIKKLEAGGVLAGGDKYITFLRGIALEVVNRQEIREQQRKEIKRLTIALRNLRKHEQYMKDKTDEFNNYLRDVLLHYGPTDKKKKKKASRPVKFSYKKLEKKGVIVESEVPKISRGQTHFEISADSPGVFTVRATIGPLKVDATTLYLDDLLEKHQAHISTLDLEQVSLDVNMTLHLLNELFLK